MILTHLHWMGDLKHLETEQGDVNYLAMKFLYPQCQLSEIKLEQQILISNGEIIMGEPCAPFPLTQT